MNSTSKLGSYFTVRISTRTTSTIKRSHTKNNFVCVAMCPLVVSPIHVVLLCTHNSSSGYDSKI